MAAIFNLLKVTDRKPCKLGATMYVDSGFAIGGLAVYNQKHVIHRARLCPQAPQARPPNEKISLKRVGNFQFPQVGKIEFPLTRRHCDHPDWMDPITDAGAAPLRASDVYERGHRRRIAFLETRTVAGPFLSVLTRIRESPRQPRTIPCALGERGGRHRSQTPRDRAVARLVRRGCPRAVERCILRSYDARSGRNPADVMAPVAKTRPRGGLAR